MLKEFDKRYYENTVCFSLDENEKYKQFTFVIECLYINLERAKKIGKERSKNRFVGCPPIR